MGTPEPEYSNQPCRSKMIAYGVMAGMTVIGTVAGSIAASEIDNGYLLAATAFSAMSATVFLSKWAEQYGNVNRMNPRPKGDLTKYLEDCQN